MSRDLWSRLATTCLVSAALLLSRPASASWPSSTLVNVPACTAAGDQEFAKVVADGTGGVIVTWFDFRSGTSADIYAQRISAAGAPVWAADGVPVCAASGDQTYPTIATDGAGGAYIAWNDLRSGLRVYGQHLDAGGSPHWDADGIPLCSNPATQQSPEIIGDGAGGAVVAWLDTRNGS
jgi:hypothetical protein